MCAGAAGDRSGDLEQARNPLSGLHALCAVFGEARSRQVRVESQKSIREIRHERFGRPAFVDKDVSVHELVTSSRRSDVDRE